MAALGRSRQRHSTFRAAIVHRSLLLCISIVTAIYRELQLQQERVHMFHVSVATGGAELLVCRRDVGLGRGARWLLVYAVVDYAANSVLVFCSALESFDLGTKEFE